MRVCVDLYTQKRKEYLFKTPNNNYLLEADVTNLIEKITRIFVKNSMLVEDHTDLQGNGYVVAEHSSLPGKIPEFDDRLKKNCSDQVHSYLFSDFVSYW